MKSIYFWIVAALFGFGILPAAADNVQFTINVPNPDGIVCQINGEDYPLEKGANKFDLPEYTNLYFSGKAPWKITGIINKEGTAASGFYGDSWYCYVYTSMQDEVFTISMQNLDEFRTDSLIINVDDASLVSAMLGGYYTNLTLTDGENVIKFDPAMETFLNITARTNLPIYKVERDGVPVASPDGRTYEIADLQNGMVIDVTATLPDEDRTVNFSYSEEGFGSVTVSIDNVPVEDFNNETLAVKLGSSLTIYGKTDYKFSEVKINDKVVGDRSWDGSYSFYSYNFTIMEDTEVYVDAKPYGNIKATVVVADPELVKIYKGYSQDDENQIPLQPGENIIELMENASVVSWSISKNAITNGITLNGETYPSYQTSYTFKDGDVLVFDVTEKVFDKTAVAWLDNPSGKANSVYFSFNSMNDQSVEYKFDAGYNFISFYEGMNPFYATWYGQSDEIENIHLTGKVYLNDELLVPQYENSTSYSFDLANDDVLKFFMDGAPVDCSVAIEIAEDVEANVVKDIVTAVENPAEGFDCFAGTQVSISGTAIKVTVNDEIISADKADEEVIARSTDDVYTFIITDPSTKVSVEKDSQAAISDITLDGNATDVFNTLGAKVGNSLNDLTPGLYIVKGKKVLVK